MKKILVNNEGYYYKVTTYMGEECTKFYIARSPYTRKKFFLFGPPIIITPYEEIFYMWYNIEDATYSADDIQKRLLIEISLWKTKEARKQEIKSGEIINN